MYGICSINQRDLLFLGCHPPSPTNCPLKILETDSTLVKAPCCLKKLYSFIEHFLSFDGRDWGGGGSGSIKSIYGHIMNQL